MLLEKLYGKTLEQLRAEAAMAASAKAALTANASGNNDNNDDNLPSEKMYQKTRLDTL